MDLTLKQELKQKQSLSQQLKQSLVILQLGATELAEVLREELEVNPLLERDQESLSPSRVRGDLSFLRQPEESMESKLRAQLYQQASDEKLVAVTDYLINYLDDFGYLKLDETDPQLQGIKPERLDQAIQLLQSLEPKGVGARSLGECLFLQLDAMRGCSPEEEQILLYDLDELAQGNLHRLEEKYHLNRKELIELLEDLQQLDPRPGMQLSPSQAEYLIPDIIIHSVKPLDIELMPHSFPALRYNHDYDDYMKQADSKTFLSTKHTRAKLILYALEQRAETMKRIISALVELQPDFFTPSRALHILNRQDVAQKLELHNSTISRAIQDKYFLWDNRVYPLSVFFPKGVKRYDGTGISSPIIKQEIQTIIEQESAEKPLSDQQIQVMLEDKGLNIARRTVSKYREELGIPRANLRKRFF